MKSGEEDVISRNAHALLLFHADKNAENNIVNINVAIDFALLKAHSMSIGACAIELIPPAIEKVP